MIGEALGGTEKKPGAKLNPGRNTFRFNKFPQLPAVVFRQDHRDLQK